MASWFGIVFAILALGFLIFIHELGHFLAARYNGVRVEVFSIGFGPTLWSKKKGDTVYALKLLPLGGYVKLYGEDNTDPKMLKAKDSFAAKTPWQRIQILSAGVIMNLLFALLILTIGFGIGMDPLLTDPESLGEEIQAGNIIHQPGLYLESVTAEGSSVEPEARLIAVNDQLVETTIDRADDFKAELYTDPVEEETSYKFQNPGGLEVIVDVPAGNSLRDSGFELYPFSFLRHKEVVESDILEPGDILLAADTGLPLQYFPSNQLHTTPLSALTVERDGAVQVIELPDLATPTVYVPEVLQDSVAEEEGIPAEIYILAVNDLPARSVSDVQTVLRESELIELEYQIAESGEVVTTEFLKPEDKPLGVYLENVYQTNQLANTTWVEKAHLGAVIVREETQVNFLLAPFAAVEASWDLSVATAAGFFDVIKSLVIEQRVSENVGGIVAITDITSTLFAVDFFAALILVAVISLSLAVINILPIPALDGGRLVFVFLEVLRGGKKVPAILEAKVHFFGFVFLMALIVVITYVDIGRVFGG